MSLKNFLHILDLMLTVESVAGLCGKRKSSAERSQRKERQILTTFDSRGRGIFTGTFII
jgi:hypothetical protein